jgi:hypothetical protein
MVRRSTSLANELFVVSGLGLVGCGHPVHRELSTPLAGRGAAELVRPPGAHTEPESETIRKATCESASAQAVETPAFQAEMRWAGNVVFSGAAPFDFDKPEPLHPIGAVTNDPYVLSIPSFTLLRFEHVVRFVRVASLYGFVFPMLLGPRGAVRFRDASYDIPSELLDGDRVGTLTALFENRDLSVVTQTMTVSTESVIVGEWSVPEEQLRVATCNGEVWRRLQTMCRTDDHPCDLVTIAMLAGSSPEGMLDFLNLLAAAAPSPRRVVSLVAFQAITDPERWRRTNGAYYWQFMRERKREFGDHW